MDGCFYKQFEIKFTVTGINIWLPGITKNIYKTKVNIQQT